MSACDACRRRRVKCNRLQPCDRCTKSSIVCTFGQSESRTSISYTRRLEQKVARLESLVGPGSRFQSVSQESLGSNTEQDVESIDLLVGPDDDYVHRCSTASSYSYYRFHAALNVLRVIGNACGPEDSVAGSEMLDAVSVLSTLPGPPSAIGLLPAQQRTLDLTTLAARRALVSHDCIDRAQYALHLKRLYDTDSEDYDEDDQVFLALVFAALALGRRYEERSEDGSGDNTKGCTYFRASRTILDKHCAVRNLNSLRAMILQVRFMLSYSHIASAYRYLCRAIGDALQMGLHLSTPSIQSSFNESERFERRRVFAVLYMMDTYLSSIIGVPKVLATVDGVQILGLPDSELADEGAAFIARNPNSPLAEAVLCQKLYRTHVHMIDLYLTGEPSNTHEAPAERVLELAHQLEDWNQNLPEIPPELQDEESVHGQLFLRLHLATAQLTLYRPFVHHLARRRDDPKFSVRGFEYGSRCVQAAMQIVWLIEAFRANGIFHEAIWFHTYALCFAGSILTYFALYSQQRATVEESIAAARKASSLLGLLGMRNPAARKINESLTPLIDACQREI